MKSFMKLQETTMENFRSAEETVTERLCAVVAAQAQIIRTQHEVIEILEGVDPTEEQGREIERACRKLSEDIYHL